MSLAADKQEDGGKSSVTVRSTSRDNLPVVRVEEKDGKVTVTVFADPGEHATHTVDINPAEPKKPVKKAKAKSEE